MRRSGTSTSCSSGRSAATWTTRPGCSAPRSTTRVQRCPSCGTSWAGSSPPTRPPATQGASASTASPNCCRATRRSPSWPGGTSGTPRRRSPRSWSGLRGRGARSGRHPAAGRSAAAQPGAGPADHAEGRPRPGPRRGLPGLHLRPPAAPPRHRGGTRRRPGHGRSGAMTQAGGAGPPPPRGDGPGRWHRARGAAATRSRGICRAANAARTASATPLPYMRCALRAC